ncbi:MAG: UDP-N-acetylglucosamine 1-carboxyvinyltransferase 2 [Chlamydiae bacterium]|nr:UDP-N-acetylglucosamine 1-carboxyvinyltransferase 2 [Chlamydiota bacterium]
MEYLDIEGGSPLKGSIRVQGAKNAITKLLVASLVSDKRCVFKNVPDIGDVEVTVALCQEIGSEVNWDKKNKTIEIITKELSTAYVPQRFSGGNRIPILMIGALLGRTTEDIIVPTVGGCNIGKRKVDYHILALQKLGATIEYRHMKQQGAYFAQAHNGLQGAVIELPYPSVGATENTILAALRANGKTVIKNAAIEPEIIDLVLFLQKMGANISIEGHRTICIEKTCVFYEVEHTVIGDRIEAASFAMAALATKGHIFVEGIVQNHMLSFLNQFRKVGGGFQVKDEGIEFFYQSDSGKIHLETDVYPGFTTDWQQPYAVVLTQIQGTSIIHETVYEKRFGYIKTLKEMGANIELFTSCLGNKPCRFKDQSYEHSCVIHGKTVLHGKEIHIPDLRAGFAYVLAALVAKGKSKIYNLHYLDRGYDHVVQKLQTLGANVARSEAQNKESIKPLEKELIETNSYQEIRT